MFGNKSAEDRMKEFTDDMKDRDDVDSVLVVVEKPGSSVSISVSSKHRAVRELFQHVGELARFVIGKISSVYDLGYERGREEHAETATGLQLQVNALKLLERDFADDPDVQELRKEVLMEMARGEAPGKLGERLEELLERQEQLAERIEDRQEGDDG